jgi:sugar O-acyltransferase (sialic acid O-acetyltransferase NeuD family)
MTKKKLVIFGSGELAEVAAFYFAHDTQQEIACFCVDGQFIEEDSFAGHPIVPFEEIEKSHPRAEHDFFVAVGYSGINKLREEKCVDAMAKGYELTSYVSSRATVFPGFEHGWNNFILEDNTIQPFARIGNGVTLWSGNHIGHHSSIGDFAFISSHVVISGGVSIGERSFIGVNATLNDHITIGKRCVVGSGALVTKDLEDESVMTAEPSKRSKIPSSRLRGF